MPSTLHDLFLHELKDLYSAEHQIASALPQMISAAQDDELKHNLEEHLEQTQEQIGR